MLVNCKRYYCVQRNKNNNISILRKNDSIFDIATDVFILQAQTKHARLPFSGKFLSNLPNHISHSTEKKGVLIGVNVVTEVEQP